ncbi:glycosyltransferase family 2 protein [Arthrobacter sp. B3I4]|uniref:glycosyltransferase family 2 protein n=1 Tax=Arthrobacter sp. B3I4 TaxID=3042267 RepID=UPI002788139F|nr:glycosyltransferase family 2 protein [Arthrobacter sp. B3I4]MDQ0755119.1 GT2 family glycosyltransferase [Arthrobacter sp. B3I4]
MAGSHVIDVENEVMPDPAGRILELLPAMPSEAVPDWAGARWVGAVDLESLNGYSQLRLQESLGYSRARLLVRNGAAVRGFIELDATDGSLARSQVEAAAAELPAAAAPRAASATPSITVIVCTRDRAECLRKALEAILRLDYPNFDVIVVDNAARSSDTRDMVRKEFPDPRLTLISERRPGLSHARNAGLRHAQGDIVAYTDDDVVVDEGWLHAIAAGFEQAPDVACVTGLVPAGELRSQAQGYFDSRVGWSKTVAPKVYSLADPPADLPVFPFCVGAFGTGANFALDRRAALALGAFDTALGVGTRTGGGEDLDMFTRVILSGRSLVVQPSAVVWHRHRADLEELIVQARGYGNGLGAWLAKIFMNPRTARMALARAPRGAAYFLRNIRSHRSGAGVPGSREPRNPVEAKALRTELVYVALGPLNYLLQRRLGRRRRAG